VAAMTGRVEQTPAGERAAIDLAADNAVLTGGRRVHGLRSRHGRATAEQDRRDARSRDASQEWGSATHWTTFPVFEDVGVAQRRVVHGGGRSALATNRPTAAVGNPCLTRRPEQEDRSNRLPCPCSDCHRHWPPDGPHETRSLQGAGRPRRATGCCATPTFTPVRCERRSVRIPRGLPARQVIPQLVGVCP
jgi:hypothetical protein